MLIVKSKFSFQIQLVVVSAFSYVDLASALQHINVPSFVSSVSPSGKLVQIEYALAAVAAGAPSVGIKGMDSWKSVDWRSLPRC